LLVKLSAKENLSSKSSMKPKALETQSQPSNQDAAILEVEKENLELSLKLAQVQDRLAELESADRDHQSALLELHETKSKCRQYSLQLEANMVTLQSIVDEKTRSSDELDHTKRERDELLHALEDFSSQLSQVHSEISVLTSERDNALQLYKQVRLTH
jgi:chromosome segregation ATPase